MEAANVLLIALVVGAYCRIRNLYYKSIALQYRFKLFNLRDRLRRYVIEERIPNDQFFESMDRMLCNAIREADYFNIWVAMYAVKHADQEKLNRSKEKLGVALESNPLNKEIYQDFVAYIRWYIAKKHYFVKLVGMCSSRTALMFDGIKKFRLQASSAIKTVILVNEPSIAPKHAIRQKNTAWAEV